MAEATEKHPVLDASIKLLFYSVGQGRGKTVVVSSRAENKKRKLRKCRCDRDPARRL